MGWVAPVLGIASTLFGASQQKKAASAQGKQAQTGVDWIKQVYGDSQGNFAPYLQAGQGGLQGLNALAAGDYSGFENSPDYLYARGEMQDGIEAGAAARGSLYSGGTNLDLARHLNGLASQNLGAYRGQLMDMSRLGAQSAGSIGSIGAGTMSNMQSGLGALGSAQASSYGANAGAGYGIANTLGNYFAPKPTVTQSSYPAPAQTGTPYTPWGAY